VLNLSLDLHCLTGQQSNIDKFFGMALLQKVDKVSCKTEHVTSNT
jgi:hypothetical protein